MKKITLEEKINIITAYTEGIPVELYDKDSDDWLIKRFDVWDFEKGIYRIKPEATATTKFKVGDILVCKSDEGFGVVDRYEVTEVGQEYYRLDDMVSKPCEAAELEFANIKDVLWFFETYDHISKRYSMHPTRMTIPEMDEEFGANHDTLRWKPMYNLGFKLKEN